MVCPQADLRLAESPPTTPARGVASRAPAELEICKMPAFQQRLTSSSGGTMIHLYMLHAEGLLQLPPGSCTQVGHRIIAPPRPPASFAWADPSFWFGLGCNDPMTPRIIYNSTRHTWPSGSRHRRNRSGTRSGPRLPAASTSLCASRPAPSP